MFFDHLNLSRISNLKFFYTWRALRLRASHLFLDSVIHNSDNNFKYLCLGFESTYKTE